MKPVTPLPDPPPDDPATKWGAWEKRINWLVTIVALAVSLYLGVVESRRPSTTLQPTQAPVPAVAPVQNVPVDASGPVQVPVVVPEVVEPLATPPDASPSVSDKVSTIIGAKHAGLPFVLALFLIPLLAGCGHTFTAKNTWDMDVHPLAPATIVVHADGQEVCKVAGPGVLPMKVVCPTGQVPGYGGPGLDAPTCKGAP